MNKDIGVTIAALPSSFRVCLRTSFQIENTGMELAGAAPRVAEDKDLKIAFVLRIQVPGVNSTPVPHSTKGVHYMKIWSSLVETAQEIYIDLWSGVVLVHVIRNMREWRYICSFQVLALCGRFSPCERTPLYPLSRRLGGFRNLSGRFGEWEWCTVDIHNLFILYSGE